MRLQTCLVVFAACLVSGCGSPNPPSASSISESPSKSTVWESEPDVETASSSATAKPLVRDLKTSVEGDAGTGYVGRIQYTGTADNKTVLVEVWVHPEGGTIFTRYLRDWMVVTETSTPFGAPHDSQHFTADSDGKKHLALAQEFDTTAIKKAVDKLDARVKKLLPKPGAVRTIGLGDCIVCGGLRYGLAGLMYGTAAACCVAGAGVSCPLCAGVAGTLALFMTDAIDCNTFCR